MWHDLIDRLRRSKTGPEGCNDVSSAALPMTDKVVSVPESLDEHGDGHKAHKAYLCSVCTCLSCIMVGSISNRLKKLLRLDQLSIETFDQFYVFEGIG